MGYVKWGLISALVLVVVSFFYYFLPQHDIVRITGIDVTRVDVGTTADGSVQTRDVRFIFAKYPDGGSMEYRNEDTGWGFPFYFKFDSAALANQASDFRSTDTEPRWVVVRHYGWRITWWGDGVFPNALSMWPASGPDHSVIPWFNIIFLTVLITGILVIRRILIVMRQRHVDPVLEDIDQEWDETASWWRRQWRALFGSRR